MKIRNFLILVLFFLLICTVSFYSVLPYYIEHHFIPEKAADSGINLLYLHIDKLDSDGLSISGVRIGSSAEQYIDLDSVRVQFSPLALFNRQIQEVTLSGLNMAVSFADGHFSIGGLPTSPKKHQDEQEPDIQDIVEMLSQLPVRVGKISILNSTCTADLDGRSIIFPYNLVIDAIDYDKASIGGKISLLLMGKSFNISGQAEFAANHFSAAFSAGKIPINLPTDIFSNPPDDFFGTFATELEGKISGKISPFSPTYQTDIAFHEPFIRYQTLQIEPDRSTGKPVPLIIKLEGNLNEISASLTGLYLKDPYPVFFESIHMQAYLKDDDLSLQGETSIKMPLIISGQPLSSEPLSLLQNFKFKQEKENWTLTSSTGIKKGTPAEKTKISINSKGTQFRSDYPDINLSGAGSKKDGKIDIKIKMPSLAVSEAKDNGKSAEKTNLSADIVEVNGKIYLANLDTTPSIKGDISASGKNILFSNGSVSGKTGISVSANISYDMRNKNVPISAHAAAQIINGSVNLPTQKIEASGISAKIPFMWPFKQAKEVPGEFAVNSFKNQDYDFGEVSGKIILAGATYSITSHYSSSLLEGLSATVDGFIDLSEFKTPRAEFTLLVPKYSFNSATPFLKKLAPGLDFFGDFELTANIGAGISGITGSAVADLTGTTISQASNKLEIAGISVHFPLPNISQLKSGTSILTFDNAKIGDMRLDGGKALFQMESKESMLIESSSIYWAGGKLDVMGTRVNNKKRKQTITMYCNGLNLAGILSQTGISNVSGDGKVNGKIPFQFENGKIGFDDAFLYSTPGTGGSIKIKSSDILLSGIPRNTVQYSQLDFAGEALKNFNYKWVTLDLQSKGESAVLAMKLEGKPSSPLPFQYDIGAGSFVRMAEGSKGIDYPISLDVNFHLPLNKIINYGKNFKDLF